MLEYMVIAFLIVLGMLFISIVVWTAFAAAILLVTFKPVDVEVDIRNPRFKISRNAPHANGDYQQSEIIRFPDPNKRDQRPRQ